MVERFEPIYRSNVYQFKRWEIFVEPSFVLSDSGQKFSAVLLLHITGGVLPLELVSRTPQGHRPLAHSQGHQPGVLPQVLPLPPSLTNIKKVERENSEGNIHLRQHREVSVPSAAFNEPVFLQPGVSSNFKSLSVALLLVAVLRFPRGKFYSAFGWSWTIIYWKCTRIFGG